MKTVGIIGAGIAGATAAALLSRQDVAVKIFESGSTILNGPPMCHLHAGGSLYPELPLEQCLTLLEQSIAIVRAFPESINNRPTVIAFPKNDARNSPRAFIEKLQKIRSHYKYLVEIDPKNEVLGNPACFFSAYDEQDLERVAKLPPPYSSVKFDDWMAPVVRSLDIDKLKMPLVIVQEPGMSLFRVAATAKLMMERHGNCELHTDTKVTSVSELREGAGWIINAATHDLCETFQVDYLINAAGYRAGYIDEWAGVKHKRQVEFKSSYLCRWPSHDGLWPEVIFTGERGSATGMAQLTPYSNGVFQLHGMTEEITLFKQGLVSSLEARSQPLLGQDFIERLENAWDNAEVLMRTAAAQRHLTRFIPGFADAQPLGIALYGAQQIPGDNPLLRASDVYFASHNYAGIEIVKASSAIAAANKVIEQLFEEGIIPRDSGERSAESSSIAEPEEILQRARQLAIKRGIPIELADFYGWQP